MIINLNGEKIVKGVQDASQIAFAAGYAYLCCALGKFVFASAKQIEKDLEESKD